MARYPKGLTRRTEGWRISVKVNGRLRQRSLKPSVSQADAEAELLKTRQRWGAGHQGASAGTLEADFSKHITDHFAGRSAEALEERTRHLTLWQGVLGAETQTDDVTNDDVSRVLQAWKLSGLAADTCNKRRAALAAFYNARGGKAGRNPVRDVAKFTPPDPLPRGIQYTLIERAFGKIPWKKTKARLRVMAYTGIRPVQLRKLTPDHWDRRRHILTVPGTMKGRGTKPYTIPLSAVATKALKEFDSLDAWGRFTSAPMARMWRAAATVAKLPPGTVPYDMRHSVGTRIFQKTGNLKAVKDLLGHSSFKMSERYMLAAVQTHKVKAMRAAFGSR